MDATDRDAVHTSRSRADRPVESSSRRSEQRAEASELAADDAAGERKSREPANPPADAAWVDRLRDSIGDRVVEAEKLGVSKESVAMTVGRDGAVERSALETRNEHLAQQVDTLAGRNERLIAAVKALTAERNQLATQVTEQGRAIEQIQARFDRVTPRLDSLDREHGRDWSAPADRPETTCEQVNGFATAAVESSNGFGATNTHDRDGADR